MAGGISDETSSGRNVRALGDRAAAFMLPFSVRMSSEPKRLLNVYQMMAGHCLLFSVDGDEYKGGVAFLHLVCPVNPLWPTGDCPDWGGLLFSCVYLPLGEQKRTHLCASIPPRPEIRLHSLF